MLEETAADFMLEPREQLQTSCTDCVGVEPETATTAVRVLHTGVQDALQRHAQRDIVPCRPSNPVLLQNTVTPICTEEKRIGWMQGT
eukprot:3030899-Prymnesium_polylepis.1